jgi:hypothetical protein
MTDMTEQTSTACVRLARASTVLGAVISTTIAWTWLVKVSHVHLDVKSGSSTSNVGLIAVIAVAALAGAAGWGLLTLFERRMRHPLRAWIIVATVFYTLSLLGPLGGATTAAKLSLASLHTTVAVIVIVGLARSRRRWAAPAVESGSETFASVR